MKPAGWWDVELVVRDADGEGVELPGDLVLTVRVEVGEDDREASADRLAWAVSEVARELPRLHVAGVTWREYAG